MLLLRHVPRPPLSMFIESFWLTDRYICPHATERILPTGACQLVINLHEDRFTLEDDGAKRGPRRQCPGSVFCGPFSKPFVLRGDQQFSVLGVLFKPGGSFRFLPVPVSELRDAQLSLGDLWGALADELRERLLVATTPVAKFRLTEDMLCARAALTGAGHPGIDFAIREFVRAPDTRFIGEMAEYVGLSRRHFIQLFSDQVGLTPKVFCRVRRFQDVLGRTLRGDHVDWLDVALSCGYYDQAHLISDFRAFAGVNPTTYLARRGEHFNHLAIS